MSDGQEVSKSMDSRVTEGYIVDVEYMIDDALAKRDDLIKIMRASGEFLQSRDRDPIPEARAKWRLWLGPQNQTFISLQLDDASGYSSDHNFTPSQLVTADIRELRLLGIWNNLLRVRSHRDLERLNELISQMEGE